MIIIHQLGNFNQYVHNFSSILYTIPVKMMLLLNETETLDGQDHAIKT